MAWLEDSVEEFKKLPTAGKVGIGAVGLLVVGIALYERSKAASTATSPITGAAASGVYSGSQLPAMDTSGGGSSSSGSTSTPAPTPAPVPAINNGLLGPLVRIWQGGPTGQPGQTRWWFQAPGGKQTLLNPQLYQNSSIVYGGQGRVWEKTASGQQILLTSGSTPQPTQGGTGGGPDGASLFSTAPAMTAPRMPRLATHTMLPGETISGIAARLGVPVQVLQSVNASKTMQPGTVLNIP